MLSLTRTPQLAVEPLGWPLHGSLGSQLSASHGNGTNASEYSQILKSVSAGENCIHVSTELSSHHQLCVASGVDSRLDFLIRVVLDVLKINDGNLLLSSQSVIDLCCVAIELMNERYRIEREMLVGRDGHSPERILAEARAVLEYSQGISNKDGLLDVRVYCSYLTLELSLGNEIEVIKVCCQCCFMVVL